jgi:hypothetical protein
MAGTWSGDVTVANKEVLRFYFSSKDRKAKTVVNELFNG